MVNWSDIMWNVFLIKEGFEWINVHSELQVIYADCWKQVEIL